MAAGSWGELCSLVADVEQEVYPDVYEFVARRLYAVLTVEQEAKLIASLQAELNEEGEDE